MGISIPLFTSIEEKVWLEHKNSLVDIAIIPLPYSLPMSPDMRAIDKNWANVDMKVFPSDSVTLVGYPRMFLDKKNSLPIYKTGSVASEIDYDFDGDPCFIIDVAAFRGNSGSPVFAISNGSYIDQKNNRVFSPEIVIKFLGVYSAGYTINEEILVQEIKNQKQGIIHEEDLHLGVVWKANLVQEIINGISLDEYKKIAEKLIKSGKFNYKIARDFTTIF